MKRERREMVGDLPPRKRTKKSIAHNKTKTQYVKLGNQLLERSKEFASKATAVVSQPNNGIPSLSDIRMQGRKVQDKEVLKTQLAQERKTHQN